MPRFCVWALGPAQSSSISFSAMSTAPPEGSRSKMRPDNVRTFDSVQSWRMRPSVKRSPSGSLSAKKSPATTSMRSAAGEAAIISRASGPPRVGRRRRPSCRDSVADGDREVSCCASQVNQPPKLAQIEGSRDVRRTHEPISVHRQQEFPESPLHLEEARKYDSSQPKVCCHRFVASRIASSRLPHSLHKNLFE